MSSSNPANKRRAAPRTPAAVSRQYVRTGVRSTREVQAHLQRRGVAPAAAARLIQQARGEGLLDDRAAARLWAGHWARQGYASAAIQAKLTAKGFPDHASAEALRASVESGDEVRVRALVDTYLLLERSRRPRPAPDLRAAARRVARRLVARGFDPDLVARTLPDVHAER